MLACCLAHLRAMRRAVAEGWDLVIEDNCRGAVLCGEAAARIRACAESSPAADLRYYSYRCVKPGARGMPCDARGLLPYANLARSDVVRRHSYVAIPPHVCRCSGRAEEVSAWYSRLSAEEVLHGAKLPAALPWPLMQLSKAKLGKRQEHKTNQVRR